MLETIIFLCRAQDFVTIAEKTLRAQNPDVRFISIDTRAALLDLPDATLRSARLIGFTTGVIVPTAVLGNSAMAPIIFILGRRNIPAGTPSDLRSTRVRAISAPPRM